MSLTSKQRAFLKSEAHTLKPIVQIGKNGLNDHIKTSVRNALDARELIKVTLLQNTMEDIHEVAEILEDSKRPHQNSSSKILCIHEVTEIWKKKIGQLMPDSLRIEKS